MTALGDVTDGEFDREVLNAEVPVLVDFWGEHCPACRVIAPILQDCAQRFTGKVKILKINSDENGEAMVRYRVMALPTVLAFSAGQVVGQLTGARSKKDFDELIERALAS
jgi:thioredoxin 1